MLYGYNPSKVIEALKARLLHQGKGNQSSDGRRIALVLEGGGMRSVCSASGAVALAQLGLGNAFDDVVATSAGVMNASYMLTNQPLLGISVYFENCTTKAFLNPWRFWKMLDVDYVVDHVAKVDKRIDFDALACVTTNFYAAVCERSTGTTKLMNVVDSKAPIPSVMKAAMAIPVLYNRSIEIGGSQYIDAGTLIPFPLDETLALGATDILVLLTRPATFVEKEPTSMMKRIFAMSRQWKDQRLQSEFARRHKRSQAMRDMALGRVAPPPGVNIAAICTEETDAVETGTTDVSVTYDTALRYGTKTMHYFGASPDIFQLPSVKARLRRTALFKS